jgi:hypothetical protein
MHHEIDALLLEQTGHGSPVPEVTLMEGYVRGHGLPVAEDQVVEDHRLVACFLKLPDTMASNVSCTSYYQYFHGIL